MRDWADEKASKLLCDCCACAAEVEGARSVDQAAAPIASALREAVEAERAACEELARNYRQMRLSAQLEAETEDERELHGEAVLAAERIAHAIALRKDPR